MKIKHPQTEKKISVKTFSVKPREVLKKFSDKEFSSAQDLSWNILSQRWSEIEDEQYGDCAENNFGLSIIENALDWAIGLKALGYMKAYTEQKKLPKPFRVAVSKNGEVFIITYSGKVF